MREILQAVRLPMLQLVIGVYLAVEVVLAYNHGFHWQNLIPGFFP